MFRFNSRVKGIFIYFIFILAAKIATEETLMFLDSHVEVLNGRLLYLLEEIQKDRSIIFSHVK